MASSRDPRTPAGIIFYEGQEKPRQYVIFRKAMIKGQCDMEVFTTSSLQLEYPFLDKEQCEIFYQDGQWIYRNLSSDVFTFVGGKLLKEGAETVLTHGTVIRLSNDRMLTAVFLEKFVSSTDWQIINMDDGRHVVKICDDSSQDGSNTITLQYNSGRWFIQEIGSVRVVFNGEVITQPTPIQVDDIIEIGETHFLFEGAGLVYGYPIQEGGLSIQIDERSAHQALKKVTLLKDINLSIEPGNMVLILGGSGAGKSTFVNAVTGYEKAKATIKEGDIDYYRQYNQVKHRIGFVPQDNLMREDDTVGDTVMNAAEMRLPNSMSAEQKKRRVAAVLETFGLSGREKELVSKLSGGQKKRLSICMEFVSSPSLFILDEPDSGLDGIMATELMENLRLIACQGRIVMVITHAPDRVAHLFDKVIVLAKGTEDKIGQLGFYGGIQECLDFFDASSLEGVVKRINALNEGGEGRSDEFIEKYKIYNEERSKVVKSAFRDADRQKEEAEEGSGSGHEEEGLLSSPEEEKKVGSYKGRAAQVPIYLGKLFRLFVSEKNWKVLPMAAIIAVLVVYVIGGMMFTSMEGTTYGSLAVVCVCIWNGMFNSIQVVCKERNIIKREHRAGLHISSYLAAHMIYQAFICAMQVIITIVIFKLAHVHFPDTGLMTGSFVLDLFICMFLATYASDMLALMVSCIVRTTTTAMTVMPFLLIIQLVFAGSIFPIKRPTAKFLSNFSISNWGIIAVNVASDYNHQPSTLLLTALNNMNSDDENDIVVKVKKVVELPEINEKVGKFTAEHIQNPAFDYDKNKLAQAWLTLALFSVIYALIGLFFLERVDQDKR